MFNISDQKSSPPLFFFTALASFCIWHFVQHLVICFSPLLFVYFPQWFCLSILLSSLVQNLASRLLIIHHFVGFSRTTTCSSRLFRRVFILATRIETLLEKYRSVHVHDCMFRIFLELDFWEWACFKQEVVITSWCFFIKEFFKAWSHVVRNFTRSHDFVLVLWVFSRHLSHAPAAVLEWRWRNQRHKQSGCVVGGRVRDEQVVWLGVCGDGM